ncbi:hypothetical protein FRC02_001731 [Tulasnella sp. 418]|nr:hypothetical protein FRC02_001731 [Tulasnella sp. 418]
MTTFLVHNGCDRRYLLRLLRHFEAILQTEPCSSQTFSGTHDLSLFGNSHSGNGANHSAGHTVYLWAITVAFTALLFVVSGRLPLRNGYDRPRPREYLQIYGTRPPHPCTTRSGCCFIPQIMLRMTVFFRQIEHKNLTDSPPTDPRITE